VLADDHAIVRMGFRLLLEGVGARVLAEADSGEAAQQLMPNSPRTCW
jgi:two-component system invasion response regulator UvrY